MEFKDVVLPRRQAVPDRCLIIWPEKVWNRLLASCKRLTLINRGVKRRVAHGRKNGLRLFSQNL